MSLYCAICAAPCLFPRARIALPTPKKGHQGSDTTDIALSDLYPSQDEINWEHGWHALRVGQGVLPDPDAYLESSNPHNPIVPSGIRTHRGRLDTSPRRTIQVHDYCLTHLLQACRGLSFTPGFSPEEEIMMSWSLPKWIGFGPWSTPQPCDRTTESRIVLAGLEYWAGTKQQRARYQPGIPDSHFMPEDHTSPIHIPLPCPPSPSPLQRTTQCSKFLELPSHVHVKILLLLLPPQFHTPPRLGDIADPDIVKLHPSQVIPDHQFADFHNLQATCAQLRELDVPSSTFHRLSAVSVEMWKRRLIQTLQSTPNGSNSANGLSYALHEAFTAVIHQALAGVIKSPSPLLVSDDKRIDSEQATGGYTARDVWRWWRSDPVWRSRRRVWYCMVHAYTTARNAGW